MGDYKTSNDEFDYMLELVVAVLFMAIGIVGTVFMIRQFNRQTEVSPRVDKVRVSSIDQSDRDPFYFTGYQAYMFAWMMDGHNKTDLYWFAPGAQIEANTDDTSTNRLPSGDGWIGFTPGVHANGFIVLRNRAIVGSAEYSTDADGTSVKNVIAQMAGGSPGGDCSHSAVPSTQDLGQDIISDFYRAFKKDTDTLKDNDQKVHLQLTDLHNDSIVGVEVDPYEPDRIDYVWSLHPCTE